MDELNFLLNASNKADVEKVLLMLLSLVYYVIINNNLINNLFIVLDNHVNIYIAT